MDIEPNKQGKNNGHTIFENMCYTILEEIQGNIAQKYFLEP